MMRRRLIEIECSGDGHDGLQMRWPLHRGLHLRSSEIANTDHSDIGVRQRLLRSPLDEVVHVATFLAVEKSKGSVGTTGASAVCNDVYVAARNEEVACTCLDKACGCAKVLNLPRIRRSGNQYGVSAGLHRTMHVRQQRDSTAHRDGNIIVARHRMGRL